MEIEVAAEVGDLLGESPSWSVRTQTLAWVDIEGRRFHRMDGSGGIRTMGLADRPAAIVARTKGSYLLAAEHALRVVSDDSHEVREIAAVPSSDVPGSRLNDGKCDPQGRFWTGTVTPSRRHAAGLYRLDHDGTLNHVLSGISVTNGLGWSPDGSTMYLADSPLRTIDEFEFDQERATIGNRRVLADVSDYPGVPDGLAVDAEGGLWVAFFGGSAVLRFDARGRLDDVVELPVRNPTSCASAGPTSLCYS